MIGFGHGIMCKMFLSLLVRRLICEIFPLSAVFSKETLKPAVCRCSCRSCLALLRRTKDNGLSFTAIESELASRKPQLLLLQSKEGERPRGGACAHTLHPTIYTHSKDNKLAKRSRPSPKLNGVKLTDGVSQDATIETRSYNETSLNEQF